MSSKDATGGLERIAYQCARWTGSSRAFMTILLLTLAWLLSGPFFHFSDSWQLVMNTVSSTVTFVMVFLLQRSQNKDSLAMQIKLNEIIAASKGANNHMINIEDLSEQEILALRKRYERVAERIHSDAIASNHSLQTEEIADDFTPAMA